MYPGFMLAILSMPEQILADGAEPVNSRERSRRWVTLYDRSSQGKLLGSVADADDVTRLLSTIKADLPPLAGIVHAAGEIDTTPLADLTDAEVDLSGRTAGIVPGLTGGGDPIRCGRPRRPACAGRSRCRR